MNQDRRHIRFEAILEAPLWVLVAAAVAVTVAVIATTVTL